MAAKDTPTVEKVAAMEAAPVPQPNARDEKRVVNFLNRYASTPKQAESFRELFGRGAGVEEIFQEHFNGSDKDGPHARLFKAEIAKVVG